MDHDGFTPLEAYSKRIIAIPPYLPASLRPLPSGSMKGRARFPRAPNRNAERTCHMRSPWRLPAEAVVCAWLLAWLVLYGLLPAALDAGFADAARVLFEGAAALLLLIPALREGSLPPPEGRGKTRYALAAAVLLPLLLASYVAAQAFCLAGSTPYRGDPEVLLGGGTYVWYVLRTCVTAPVMEELGCRWIAFGKLRRLGVKFWPAALLSTVLFSFIHVGTSPAFAVAVVPGTLLYCLIYDLTGAPWLGMAVHAVRNLIALPVSPWAGSWPDVLLDSLMFGVPRSTSVLSLLAVTAAAVLLCVFRDRIFRR